MKKLKSILLVLLFLSNVLNSFADRGIRKKNRNNVMLNISSTKSFKSDLAFNLKTGMKFNGVSRVNVTPEKSNTLQFNSIDFYQKGNTMYLVPHKHKILIPEVKQGYTGLKLVIRPKK
jgi:hypothetical protein